MTYWRKRQVCIFWAYFLCFFNKSCKWNSSSLLNIMPCLLSSKLHSTNVNPLKSSSALRWVPLHQFFLSVIQKRLAASKQHTWIIYFYLQCMIWKLQLGMLVQICTSDFYIHSKVMLHMEKGKLICQITIIWLHI